MINVKKAGMPVSKQKVVPRIVGGTDLMAALRQSIQDTEREDRAAAAKAKAPAPAKGKKASKRDPNQKEMLLRSRALGRAKQRRRKSTRSQQRRLADERRVSRDELERDRQGAAAALDERR
jgi:hypothetical protein